MMWPDWMDLPDEFIWDEEWLEWLKLWRNYVHCQEMKRIRMKKDVKK